MDDDDLWLVGVSNITAVINYGNSEKVAGHQRMKTFSKSPQRPATTRCKSCLNPQRYFRMDDSEKETPEQKTDATISKYYYFSNVILLSLPLHQMRSQSLCVLCQVMYNKLRDGEH